MATRIERLQNSLKKEQEKQDNKKLFDAANRIQMAKIILSKHTFREHRTEIVLRLDEDIYDVLKCIAEAQRKTEDGSVDKAVM